MGEEMDEYALDINNEYNIEKYISKCRVLGINYESNLTKLYINNINSRAYNGNVANICSTIKNDMNSISAGKIKVGIDIRCDSQTMLQISGTVSKMKENSLVVSKCIEELRNNQCVDIITKIMCDGILVVNCGKADLNSEIKSIASKVIVGLITILKNMKDIAYESLGIFDMSSNIIMQIKLDNDVFKIDGSKRIKNIENNLVLDNKNIEYIGKNLVKNLRSCASKEMYNKMIDSLMSLSASCNSTVK